MVGSRPVERMSFYYDVVLLWREVRPQTPTKDFSNRGEYVPVIDHHLQREERGVSRRQMFIVCWY